MGYYDNDPYHQPEKFGLEIVDTLDDMNACYSFNMFVVWRSTETGQLYYATDSGCSCPSPFENYNSLEDLTLLTNWNLFKNDLEEWAESYSSRLATEADVTELLSKVSAIMG